MVPNQLALRKSAKVNQKKCIQIQIGKTIFFSHFIVKAVALFLFYLFCLI